MLAHLVINISRSRTLRILAVHIYPLREFLYSLRCQEGITIYSLFEHSSLVQGNKQLWMNFSREKLPFRVLFVAPHIWNFHLAEFLTSSRKEEELVYKLCVENFIKGKKWHQPTYSCERCQKIWVLNFLVSRKVTF